MIRLWASLRSSDVEDIDYCIKEFKENLQAVNIDSFAEDIADFMKGEGGTRYEYILRDDPDDFALVMQGVDNEDGTFDCTLRIAYQSNQSMMQCDWIDWTTLGDMEDVIYDKDDIERFIKASLENCDKALREYSDGLEKLPSDDDDYDDDIYI